MSTSAQSPDNTNQTNASGSIPNNIIKLNKLKCEIKLVNNWKKLQLRSRFAFCEIDPIEIIAMMINYYSIYCLLETKLQFSQFTQRFTDIPTMNNIISFLKNQSKYKIIDIDADNNNNDNDKKINDNMYNNNLLLSIQIELPLIVLPIMTENNGKYYFYAFTNGKLLLYHDNEEINMINNILRRIGHKNKIFYADILSIFTDYNDDNHTFAHPKNDNFELNLLNECNISELNKLNKLNELQLEIIEKAMNNNNNRCVICLSFIFYESEEYCRISCCKHIYHFECIENLIKYSNNNQCPLCREKMKYIQYCTCNTSKIFKIKNNSLCMISHNHYFNKYYANSNKKNQKNNEYEYDEKEDGIINIHAEIPLKPCLGYLESIPSPTNSNSSISIPSQRNSSPSPSCPSTPDTDMNQLTLNQQNNQNNNNYNYNINNQNNNGNNNNNNNNDFLFHFLHII